MCSAVKLYNISSFIYLQCYIIDFETFACSKGMNAPFTFTVFYFAHSMHGYITHHNYDCMSYFSE